MTAVSQVDSPESDSPPTSGRHLEGQPRLRFSQLVNPGAFKQAREAVASVATQTALVSIAFVLYFFVRDITKDQTRDAFENARAIIEFERSLGIDWERTAQAYILDYHWMITLFNWVYMFLHWPVLLFAAVYTFVVARREYLTYRNAMIVSGAIGLIFFALYPVAPPRLADPSSFFDSLAVFSRSFELLQPQGLVNRYAALPSFHVGWNILAGFALWRSTQNRFIRFGSVASPVLMTLAVVVTANHWVVDVIAGLLIALVARLGAPRLLPRKARQPVEAQTTAT